MKTMNEEMKVDESKPIKKDKSALARMSRRKGKVWERVVADLMRKVFGKDNVRRGWQSRSGKDEADVICPYFWVECKNRKQVNVFDALEQADNDKDVGKVPIAVCKHGKYNNPLVAMKLDDFINLLLTWNINNVNAGK